MIGMEEFTDISGFFASSAQMIAECKGTVYGYLRVSTAAQKHDRQMDAMKELGVNEDHMFFDKQSGKDFNRPGYQELLAKLKENDLLVIKNIDRLGRNTKEVKEQWRIITQEKHVSIVVIDTPILNAGKELGPLGQALSDIIFAIFSMIADFDRQSIYQRLQEGLRVAMRERGVRPGRKAMLIPEGFEELKEAYEKGEISQRSAAAQLGVDRKTFRKWLEAAGNTNQEESGKQGAETDLEKQVQENTSAKVVPLKNELQKSKSEGSCSKEDDFQKNIEKEDSAKKNDYEKSHLKGSDSKENDQKESDSQQNELKKNSFNENGFREDRAKKNGLKENDLREDASKKNASKKKDLQENGSKKNGSKKNGSKKNASKKDDLKGNSSKENISI